jgi:phosphoribosylformylglycinamidine synthase
VLRAPGTNCDRETAFAFETAGARTAAPHVNGILRSPKALRDAQGLALPGGFSYGDDLGAGTVLGTRIRAAFRDEVLRLVDRGGVVLGICNGFQVLTKAGLLPRLTEAPERTTALARNLQNRYEDRWVSLVADATNAFFRKGDRISCPVAHAEGRFFVLDDTVLERLRASGQLALRYVAPEDARPAAFPWNPNGSLADVAGVTDPTGRILGLMPHPERHQFPWQSPLFHAGLAPKTPDGLLPFRNAVRAMRRAR